MLWKNGCDGKALRCGAGNRHQQKELGLYLTNKARDFLPYYCTLTCRGDRPASSPEFSASHFSRNLSDLKNIYNIYRAALYSSRATVGPVAGLSRFMLEVVRYVYVPITSAPGGVRPRPIVFTREGENSHTGVGYLLALNGLCFESNARAGRRLRAAGFKSSALI
jgi:hypothetical protein